MPKQLHWRWDYIIKPDYVNKTATLVKKVNLYDLAVASGMDVLGADKARMWSSIAIGDDGRMYVGLTLQKTDGTAVSGGVVCFTYEGCTGPGNTPWPMKGADARRSGIQLK